MKVQLLFYALCLVCVTDALLDNYIEDCCASGYWGILCKKCYQPCPLRERGLERLGEILNDAVVGQEHAVSTVIDALRSHDHTKPLVLHFAGDNGVGKTYTAKMVGEALFAVRNKLTNLYKGVLYLRGNRFCNRHRSESEHREDILRQLVAHLSQCPNALVVFDEAELPSKSVMQVFEEVLDGGALSYAGIEAHTDAAVFILISDFGVEGVTEGMTLGEVEERIHEDMSNTWQHCKQTSMVNYIVPFLPMNKTHLTQPVVQQVRNLIRKQALHPPVFISDNLHITFEYITYKPHTLQRLVQLIFDYTTNSKVYQNRNYRGIEQVFEKLVTPELTKMLSKKRDLHGNKGVRLVLYVDEKSKKVNYAVH